MPTRYRGEWRRNQENVYEIVVERPHQSKGRLQHLIGQELTVEVKWHKAKRTTLEAAIVEHVADGLIYLRRR